MRTEVKKHLYDILAESELILQFVQGKAFEDYERDALLRAGVERELMIVGEAFVRLRNAETEEDDDSPIDLISDARKIIGFRNILVHGYDTIKNDIVWVSVRNDLPKLIEDVNALLRR